MKHRAAATCLASLILIAGARFACAEDDAIVIDNVVDLNSGQFVTEPVLGFRPASQLLVKYDPMRSNDAIGVPRDVIIDAAMQFGEIQQAAKINHVNVATASLDDLKLLVAKSGYTETGFYTAVAAGEESNAKDVTLVSWPIEGDTPRRADAVAIVNMLAAGVFDTDSVDSTPRELWKNAIAPVKPEYAKFFAETYAPVQFLAHYTIRDRTTALRHMLTQIADLGQLQRSLLQDIGPVTFGNVFPQSADEMKLVIPERITKQFDVYWIEYAVTFRDLPIDKLEEVSFSVSLPPDHVALALVPLSYGPQVSVEEETKTPEVKIETKGGSVTLGEFFNRNLKYTYLKPTIAGYGLRENEIAWSLRDEAISAGSHEFVAITAVPKGEKEMTAIMSVTVKTDSKLLIFDGDVGSTRPKPMKVRFE